MMHPSDFKRIDAYLDGRGKADLSPFAYATYIANVEDGLKQKVNPSAAEVRTVCEQYLTDAQLSTYLTVAEKAVETSKQRTSSKILPFWSSVWSSIVANIIFALIIYGFYVAAVGPSANATIEAAKTSLIGNGQ